jgi:hypothetical protein
MKLIASTIVAVASISCCAAYSSQAASSRRDVLQRAVLLTGSTLLVPAGAALAIEACPPGTANCIRTTWTPPSGTKQADIAKTVSAVLSEYPQEGQADVDKGGWTIVEDDLTGSSGKARVEFKSGIGNFAKFFNGGKPFIDDLVIEIGNGAVEIRSSSRIGDSDLGVNQKRLGFLAKSLQAKGWEAPDPKY